MIRTVIQKALGSSITRIVVLPRGRNSVVYRVETKSGKTFIVKKYETREGDRRDRLVTEFVSLTFLWKHGMHDIPRPIHMDTFHGIGIYSYIQGEQIPVGGIYKEDIEYALDFLKKIQLVSKHKAAREKLPVASEACFSMIEFIDSLDKRRMVFQNFKRRSSVLLRSLYDFLLIQFDPLYQHIIEDFQDHIVRTAISPDTLLPQDKRILSPSDFGFHNAIRRPDGTLAFLDFEYFGWDDPAKLTSDFFLQPDMPPPTAYREHFFDTMYRLLGNDDEYAVRLSLVYPILALKWCLIVLNVFLDTKSKEEMRFGQLEKSKKMLEQIKEEYEEKVFPISLFY